MTQTESAVFQRETATLHEKRLSNFFGGFNPGSTFRGSGAPIFTLFLLSSDWHRRVLPLHPFFYVQSRPITAKSMGLRKALRFSQQNLGFTSYVFSSIFIIPHFFQYFYDNLKPFTRPQVATELK